MDSVDFGRVEGGRVDGGCDQGTSRVQTGEITACKVSASYGLVPRPLPPFLSGWEGPGYEAMPLISAHEPLFKDFWLYSTGSIRSGMSSLNLS